MTDDDPIEENLRPNRRPDSVLQAAKSSVRAPAIGLLLCGVFATILIVVLFVFAAMHPTVFADWYRSVLIDSQPPGIMKDELSEQFEITKNTMRLDTPMNLAWYAAALALSVAMVIGALKMMALTSYRWAILAALFAFLPISGCSCLAFPFGLWAIVQLSREHVLQGFYWKRQGAVT